VRAVDAVIHVIGWDWWEEVSHISSPELVGGVLMAGDYQALSISVKTTSHFREWKY
jgi:hypothetical protein